MLDSTRPRLRNEGYDAILLDWLDLRNMLLVARSVATAAANRTESRGAQQREDYPSMDESWTSNQVLRVSGGRLELGRSVPRRLGAAA
jgi:succinate dehydrogenase / fumarate reductase flavoprotein subunit